MGNLPAAVCLNPIEEMHDDLAVITDPDARSTLTELAGHTWMRCLLCETLMLADPLSWGSLAFCVECWNRFAGRGRQPPTTASAARRLSVEEWGSP